MIGISDDYASIETNGISFYYGYEVTDENGEWCFQAKTKGGKEITLPFSRLGARDRFWLWRMSAGWHCLTIWRGTANNSFNLTIFPDVEKKV